MNYLKDGARVVAQSAQPILFNEERGGFFVVEENTLYTQPGLFAENAPPVPASITKLQLALGMMGAGLITATEAESMASGSGIPSAIAAAINALPAEMRAPARIVFKGMREVLRADPLLAMIMAQATPAISEAEMDAFFVAWAQIQ